MISHKHKCVFFHIPKCGGQSVEDVFIHDCGLDWDRRSPLVLRRNDNPRVGPPWLAHLTYREYLEYSYISQELMDSYLKFCMVRNPYKRVESFYKYNGYDEAIPFPNFVLNVLIPNIESKGDFYYFYKPQFEYVCDGGGRIAMDDVIRLESINSELPGVLKKCGLDIDAVPYINKSERRSLWGKLRQRGKHALRGTFSLNPVVDSRIDWTEACIEAVNDIYAADFRAFGYEKN